MANSRFLHLITFVLLGTACLVLRLYQVQVGQHAIWADQAANLVRSGEIVPFERGRLVDRRGRTLVRDEKLYRIDFVYRDFRRGHPLGQVTHARSTLELRAVPLAEGAERLVDWALELLDLSPQQLASWGRGGALQTASLTLAAQRDGDPTAHRLARARDLGFYATRLCALSRVEGRAMHRLLTEGAESRSFFELVAHWRGHRDDAARARFRTELAQRMQASLADLDGLARLLDAGRPAPVAPAGSSERGRGGSRGPDRATARAALIADLEACRAKVEDGTASRLFQEAAGFGPGRLEPKLLLASVDLDWIALRLRWDDARLARWLDQARVQWLRWRDTFAVDALAAELALEPDLARWPDRVLDQTLALYALDPARAERERADAGHSRTWSAAHELLVVDQLGAAFDVPRAVREQRDPGADPVLPTEDPGVRAFADDGALLLAHCVRWREAEAGTLAERGERVAEAGRWREALVKSRLRSATFTKLVRGLFASFERHFAAAVAARIGATVEAARADERLGPAGRLVFRKEGLDRSTERAVYIRRDLGSRAQRIVRNPDYEVVHLLARYPDRYAGFEVRDTHVRVPAAFGEDGVPLAAGLVGHVRQSDILELREQREDEQELDGLLALGTRTAAEDERIGQLLPRVVRPEEVRGAEGLEALLDPELRGHNGYRERRGLADRANDRSRRWSVEPVDGSDVTLTLDLDLQRAAEDCLAHPADDAAGEGDDAWRARPVGALVLISVEGEVLAAAGMPNAPTPFEVLPADQRAQPPQWAVAMERTLTKPTFQPPGSVFKPFVAAWALDRLAWDPMLVNDCGYAAAADAAGYKDLRCWRVHGHGPVDLREALLRSCNAYFARIGESFTPQDFAAACREFGFGQPTGIDDLPPSRGGPEGGRGALREDVLPSLLDPGRRLSERELRMAGNGLGVIEATPMQVARATAALATGRLPDLRIVRALGELPLAPVSRRLEIAEPVLDFLRSAMLGVAAHSGGTAAPAELVRERLGFSVAAKTGSADYAKAPVLPDGRRGPARKHTWFTGWFPAEEPRYVLVVFCHDIMVTSSHSTIWIARDFLDRPEVRGFLEREGVLP